MSVKINDLLKTAAAYGASDLHVKCGSQPFMRIGGELRPIVDAPRMTQEDTLDMAFSMMSNRQKQHNQYFAKLHEQVNHCRERVKYLLKV